MGVHQMRNRPAFVGTRKEKLSYLALMLQELQALAEQERLEHVAFYLEMALVETSGQIDDRKPRRG